MKKSRFTDSQILAAIKQAEAGTPVPQLCRVNCIGSGWASRSTCRCLPGALEQMIEWRGKLVTIRRDNVPEYICGARCWAGPHGATSGSTTPSSLACRSRTPTSSATT